MVSLHDLHCFQAWRRMDEILVANYMLFHDVVNEEQYDLWIRDEAWELDYYLHENPEDIVAGTDFKLLSTKTKDICKNTTPLSRSVL